MKCKDVYEPRVYKINENEEHWNFWILFFFSSLLFINSLLNERTTTTHKKTMQTLAMLLLLISLLLEYLVVVVVVIFFHFHSLTLSLGNKEEWNAIVYTLENKNKRNNKCQQQKYKMWRQEAKKKNKNVYTVLLRELENKINKILRIFSFPFFVFFFPQKSNYLKQCCNMKLSNID